MKIINHVFRVNRISTTPYNPRSNGLVENHNGTLKDQLYHLWSLDRRPGTYIAYRSVNVSYHCKCCYWLHPVLSDVCEGV